jgi:hypothetical protein
MMVVRLSCHSEGALATEESGSAFGIAIHSLAVDKSERLFEMFGSGRLPKFLLSRGTTQYFTH